jgi:hypothetical protein
VTSWNLHWPNLLVGAAIGIVAGFATGEYYFRRAFEEARAESKEQARIQQLVLRAVEGIGPLEYARDSSGMITGARVDLRAIAFVTSRATADLTTTPQRTK